MNDDLNLRDDEEREDDDGHIALSDDDVDEITGEDGAAEDEVESLDKLAEEEEEGFDEDDFGRDDITDY